MVVLLLSNCSSIIFKLKLNHFLQVLQQMFKWNSPKRQPNQQDKVHLLKTTFTMRLDIERRRIEHSSITDLEEQSSTSQKVEASTTEGIQLEMVVDHEFTGKEKVA